MEFLLAIRLKPLLYWQRHELLIQGAGLAQAAVPLLAHRLGGAAVQGVGGDVQVELGFAVVLVVAVIFLFLGDWRATLIPSLSVPLSLVGTLAVMYLAGFSLNNLSIMALTIATGFVVDDAIVMIENIARYIEEGEDPFAAALKGSSQIAFTVVSLTVSLIAVLIPLLFMGDVVGRLFSEFAVTLAVTILISAVVSLTLVPMMCAQLLRRRREAAGADRLGQDGESEKVQNNAPRYNRISRDATTPLGVTK